MIALLTSCSFPDMKVTLLPALICSNVSHPGNSWQELEVDLAQSPVPLGFLLLSCFKIPGYSVQEQAIQDNKQPFEVKLRGVGDLQCRHEQIRSSMKAPRNGYTRGK